MGREGGKRHALALSPLLLPHTFTTAVGVLVGIVLTGMQWREADGDVHYTTLLRSLQCTFSPLPLSFHDGKRVPPLFLSKNDDSTVFGT